MTQAIKTKSKLGLILIVILLACVLFACNKPSIPEPDAEYTLNVLCEAFEETPSIFIKGKIARDGVIDTKICGTVNDTDKQIFLNVNGTDKIYTSKYLLKGDSGGVTVEKANTSYNATLGLLPFSLFAFKYNKNQIGDVAKTGNHIIISFLPRGIDKVFSGAGSASGGVFSISYDGKRITETVLTTTLTENGKEIRYSAHYVYTEGGKAYDSVPWVTPTNSVDYATYALTQIATKHGEQTLLSAGSERDTKVTMDAFLSDVNKISAVHVIEADNRFSLGITYSSAVSILGLGAISELEIVYDKNYQAFSVVINKGTKYIVK